MARVTTIDYNGVFQERGGDPVTAELRDDVGEMVSGNQIQTDARDFPNKLYYLLKAPLICWSGAMLQ